MTQREQGDHRQVSLGELEEEGAHMQESKGSGQGDGSQEQGVHMRTQGWGADVAHRQEQELEGQ